MPLIWKELIETVATIAVPVHVIGPQKRNRASSTLTSHLLKLSVRRNKQAAYGHYEPQPNQALVNFELRFFYSSTLGVSACWSSPSSMVPSAGSTHFKASPLLRLQEIIIWWPWLWLWLVHESFLIIYI